MPTTSPRASTSGPPELPWLIAASVWMNWPGLRGSSLVGVGTIQRTHDAASHGEPEAERIAEGEHGLSGAKLRGVAKRNIGEVAAIDLDDCQIGERVGADKLGRQECGGRSG